MIGSLNQRVALMEKTRTDDGGGGYTDSWSTIATVWASLTALSGGAEYGADAVQAQTRYRIRLRRRDDVAAGWRAVIGSRTFDVVAILDDGPQTDTMILSCEAQP